MTRRFAIFRRRFSAWRRTEELDRDFEMELESHLAMLIEDYQDRGLSADEARRQAKLRLGGFTQTRESHREARGLPMMEVFLQDLRYTLRTLRRDLGFTVFAILIAGLGIGASVTVFSVVNALMLRPLPFRSPEQLVWVANSGPDGLSGATVPVRHFTEFRNRTQAFSDVAAYFAFYGVGDSRLTVNGVSQRLSGVPISHNFLPLLGVQPLLGRSFTVEECNVPWNRRAQVLLSHALWVRLFQKDPGVVGRRIQLNNDPFTVVGVLPESFDFGTTFAPGSRIDLYFPLPLTQQVGRWGNTLAMVGRLKPGMTVAQARAEAPVIEPQIRQVEPGRSFKLSYATLTEHISGGLRPALMVLAWAVAVVMLLVCANLSNLLLGRSAARQKEMAIRAALGAGRGRLMRQLLTESVLLASAGGVLGLALSVFGTTVLSQLVAMKIPLLDRVTIDGPALAFTVVVTLATGVLFGLMPALQTPLSNEALKDRVGGGGRARATVRKALVVAEVAFACVLLVGAGLLFRSFLQVLEVDMGFEPSRAASLRVDPTRDFQSRAQRNAYYDETLRRVRETTGIEAAGLSDALPLGRNRSWGIGAKGRAYSRENPPADGFVRIVSDGYLRAMGIPLRAGRDIAESDNATSQPVILINETLAKQLWPGESALGKTVVYVDRERVVAGVVADVRHLSLEQEAGAEFYIPMRQIDDYGSVDLVVRTALEPSRLARSVREALRPLDPDLPVSEFRTLQARVDQAVSPRKFIAVLIGGFSVFALVLASLGIYAVISYSVSQRKQEFGIRLALGAPAGRLRVGILNESLALAGVGLVIGVAASWWLARAISGLLFGVTASDPWTFAGMACTLLAVAALAGYLPARRAALVDPITALRVD